MAHIIYKVTGWSGEEHFYTNLVEAKLYINDEKRWFESYGVTFVKKTTDDGFVYISEQHINAKENDSSWANQVALKFEICSDGGFFEPPMIHGQVKRPYIHEI